jgi:hypothetical protein
MYLDVCHCQHDVRVMACSYGPGAWWWETEELVRKLLLTAVAVLLDAGSPLQVCVWWGGGRATCDWLCA